MKLKFRKLDPRAVLPVAKTAGAAGLDIAALLPIQGISLTLLPGMQITVPTGLAVEIPEGFEGQIRSRSGLAARHGVFVVNSPGTVDCDYRGELLVVLGMLPGHKYSNSPLEINSGDRIAQLIISPILRIECEEVDTLSDTVRGSGGFGSTGR